MNLLRSVLPFGLGPVKIVVVESLHSLALHVVLVLLPVFHLLLDRNMVLVVVDVGQLVQVDVHFLRVVFFRRLKLLLLRLLSFLHLRLSLLLWGISFVLLVQLLLNITF